MKATIATAQPDVTAVSIELATGGPYLVVHVSHLPKGHLPPDRQREAPFYRRLHIRLRKVGPRGGWRGEPETVGFGYIDIRDPPGPPLEFSLEPRRDFDVDTTGEEMRELELEP